MSHQVVIIGGGYAGILAAQRLHAAQVTLINNRSTFTERIRLHQVAAGERRPEHSIPGLLRKAVTFVQGHVSALDLDGQQVIYCDDAGEHTLPYDSLIYALGSKTGNLSTSPRLTPNPSPKGEGFSRGNSPSPNGSPQDRSNMMHHYGAGSRENAIRRDAQRRVRCASIRRTPYCASLRIPQLLKVSHHQPNEEGRR